jgi:hypothetical protein
LLFVRVVDPLSYKEFEIRDPTRGFEEESTGGLTIPPTGSLPWSYGNWRNIGVGVWLYSNFRHPPTEHAWGQSIKVFDLSENLLNAQLPESYGIWKSVNFLILAMNELAGNWKSLMRSGCMPTT